MGVVWHSTPPQIVKLRFYGESARRVQEGFWHHSERLAPQADGTCIVTFRVSEPNEMQRWILQWGAGVAVLSPSSLRELIAGEVAHSVQRYEDRQVPGTAS